jgi:hypothetical protein
MNLKQLQAQWYKEASPYYSTSNLEDAWPMSATEGEAFAIATCANALTPHIQQQERDMELLQQLAMALEKRCGILPEILIKARARLAEYEGEKG